MIVLFVTLAALIELVGAGQVARGRIARAHPAPGELVDIGGHRLQLHPSGSVSTVVFYAGTGGTSPDWSLVGAEADRFATNIVSIGPGSAGAIPDPLRTPFDAADGEQFSYYPAEDAERGRRMGRTMRLAWGAQIMFGSGIPAIFSRRTTDPRTAELPAEAAACRCRATGLMGSRQAHATHRVLATSHQI